MLSLPSPAVWIWKPSVLFRTLVPTLGHLGCSRNYWRACPGHREFWCGRYGVGDSWAPGGFESPQAIPVCCKVHDCSRKWDLILVSLSSVDLCYLWRSVHEYWVGSAFQGERTARRDCHAGNQWNVLHQFVAFTFSIDWAWGLPNGNAIGYVFTLECGRCPNTICQLLLQLCKQILQTEMWSVLGEHGTCFWCWF